MNDCRTCRFDISESVCQQGHFRVFTSPNFIPVEDCHAWKLRTNEYCLICRDSNGVPKPKEIVVHFGAAGNGVTDDTVAIQAVIDSINYRWDWNFCPKCGRKL